MEGVVARRQSLEGCIFLVPWMLLAMPCSKEMCARPTTAIGVEHPYGLLPSLQESAHPSEGKIEPRKWTPTCFIWDFFTHRVTRSAPSAFKIRAEPYSILEAAELFCLRQTSQLIQNDSAHFHLVSHFCRSLCPRYRRCSTLMHASQSPSTCLRNPEPAGLTTSRDVTPAPFNPSRPGHKVRWQRRGNSVTSEQWQQ